jgi:hypothetical protein
VSPVSTTENGENNNFTNYQWKWNKNNYKKNLSIFDVRE